MTITKNVNIESCEVQGDKFKGRVIFTTNENVNINTPVHCDATDEGGYDSDSVNVFFQQREGLTLNIQPAGEDSTGWELFTLATLQPNTEYIFNYHAETFQITT